MTMDWIFCVFIVLYFIYCVHGGKPVYVSNGSHILSYSKDEAKVTVVYGKTGFRILGLAVDFGSKFLFWSDTSPEFKGIYRANLDGKNVTTIVKDVQEVSDISVDWVSNHIYWTDTRGKTIEIANYDGSARRVLMSRNLRGPRNIVVDPISGYIFWVDQRAKRIERSWLDGSHRRVVIKSKQYWPNQLAVSYKQRLLYWVDARNHAIFSCDFKGSNIEKLRGLKPITKGAPAYGLVVFGNTAVISTWFSTALYSVLIGSDSVVWQLEARDLGTRELYSLVSLNPATQPTRHHPCGDINGGCSHLCLPSSRKEYQCTCPSKGGLALSTDGKTCEVPTQLLLVTLQQYGEVGFLSLDTAADAEFSLVSRSTKPAAVTYDPVNQMVYWSDVSEKRIYRVHLDGTDKAIFLNSSDGIGTVQGMAFDWKRGRLYFTNVGHSGPSLDGTIYSWHRVEFAEVYTKKRKTLLHEVENPVGIALDLNQRHLYISDAGKTPKIIRTELDGQNSEIISQTGLPTGVAVFGDKVYFSMKSYDNETWGDVYIQKYYPVDGSFDTVEETDIRNEAPLSLTANNETVFYVDTAQNVLLTNNGSYQSKVLYGGGPSGLAYSPSTASVENVTDDCANSRCSDGCVVLPWNKMAAYRCICYDGMAAVLQEDEKTCARPSNFLLYADMTTINMVSLDPGTDVRPIVLHHGDIGSNFVALTYDDVTDRLYWSDHTSQAIYLSSLSKISPIMLYKEIGFIEGLVIDPDKQRLYWTVVTSQTGAGYIARLNIDRGLGSYKKLQTSRNNPRAIALHPSGKWLYWTEHKAGASGVEVYSCKNNGQRYRKLMSTDLHWPNSLVVYGDKLFIGDGRGKIIVTDIEGGNLRVLADDTSSISHVFGLAVLENILLYSDWDTNSVKMVDMESDHRTSLVTNLTRPTAVVLYHPDKLSAHTCFSDTNPCSDICRPLLRDLYECMCDGDRFLAEDDATCIEELPTTTSPKSFVTSTVDSYTIYDENTMETTDLDFHGDHIENETNFDGSKPVVNLTEKPFAAENRNNMSDFAVNETDAYHPVAGLNGFIGKGDTATEESLPHPTLMGPLVTEMITVGQFDAETQFTDSKEITDTDDELIQATVQPDYKDSDKWIVETERVDEDGIQLEPIGPPFFEECPTTETVILSVPATGSHVIYPMIPRAFESTGAKLTVSSTYRIDDEGIHLDWAGNKAESHHRLVLWAIDSHDQEVVCEINIVLQDVDPPTFTVCPENFKVSRVRDTETVHWTNPEVEDNVGVAFINGSHAPGSSFPPGMTVVNYTATDRAGNQAYCSFMVIVSEDKICDLPEIQHGGIVCNYGDDREGECSVVCEDDFVVNPIRIFKRAFNCKHPDEIESVNEAIKTQSPCLLKRYPSIVEKEFHLLFKGPVFEHKPEVLSYISDSVSDYLLEKKLCTGSVCKISDLRVYCGFGDTLCIEEEVDLENFYAVFNITMTNSTGKSNPDMLTMLEKIHQELMFLSSALSVQIQDHYYEAVANAVTARQHTWSCAQGQILEKNFCIACPVGTYHNTTIDVCQFCTKGSFQDHEGQLFCVMCRPGQTSPDGATNLSQCTALPAMDEMTLFIIVTACSFGVVFLCMAITLYLQFKRQQKRNEKSANQKKTRYNMSPNIYVAPPPILKSKLLDENATFPPRTYSIDKKHPFNIYANHDYEDVDAHLSNTPPPVYQSDTFRSSPANSLNFPSADSPSADDLSMSTLSRENTFRNSSLQFGVKRSQKEASTPSPGPQRKMSRESTFSNNSPRMMRVQRTPSSDGPLITQSPLLRLKLAAYNFNQDD